MNKLVAINGIVPLDASGTGVILPDAAAPNGTAFGATVTLRGPEGGTRYATIEMPVRDYSATPMAAVVWYGVNDEGVTIKAARIFSVAPGTITLSGEEVAIFGRCAGMRIIGFEMCAIDGDGRIGYPDGLHEVAESFSPPEAVPSIVTAPAFTSALVAGEPFTYDAGSVVDATAQTQVFITFDQADDADGTSLDDDVAVTDSTAPAGAADKYLRIHLRVTDPALGDDLHAYSPWAPVAAAAEDVTITAAPAFTAVPTEGYAPAYDEGTVANLGAHTVEHTLWEVATETGGTPTEVTLSAGKFPVEDMLDYALVRMRVTGDGVDITADSPRVAVRHLPRFIGIPTLSGLTEGAPYTLTPSPTEYLTEETSVTLTWEDAADDAGTGNTALAVTGSSLPASVNGYAEVTETMTDPLLEGAGIASREAKSGWVAVADAEEPDPGIPFTLTAGDIGLEASSVWRPEGQTTWFTPVLTFPGLEGETVDAIEWTTSGRDPIPDAETEVVAAAGDAFQLYMRDPAKNAPTAVPRVDYSVFRETETTRRGLLRFRWRRTSAGPWSAWSEPLYVPLVIPPDVVHPDWLPISSRSKEAYEAGLAGSQGQQFQRCRTWNLGIIDEAKRGWVLTAQDENGLRLVKNGNAGTDNDPVLWGFPRLDGYYGSKSGGLYLNTDDNAGAGLFISVTGWFNSGGFGTNAAAIGVYRGDGTLNWAKKVDITRPSGPGPYVSGSSGPKKAFTNGNGTSVEYFGNSFDRAGNFVARRPQVPELQQCTVFKTTKALLDADLAYAAGTKAAVYADATQSNRAVYTKSGASGSGSWSKTIELLTDAQRPIYVVEQHGSRASSITYQALFKSTDAGQSFTFVRELPIATFAKGNQGIFYVLVAPNGDVMLAGITGAFLSIDQGDNFTQKHTREVSAAHFFGGTSTTVSGARIGDASANSNGGVYAAANVRNNAFAKTASAGLPANFNVWDLACAPTNSNLLLVNTDDPTAWRSTNGGTSWAAVASEKMPGDEAFRYGMGGGLARGHSGFLFCPTNAQRVVGFTFQTVTQSIDGGASFQGRRALFFDGMHNKGTGTGPLTGTDPWKKLLTVSQDSLAATWLDGTNWMQRCGSGTGDQAFKDALAAAGAGDKPYVSGASGVILPNNRVVCCANRNSGGQTNVIVVLHERQANGTYPNLTIRNLSGKTTRGIHSAWSLADPDGYAFLGRWGIGNVEAAVASITFDDHSAHEFIDQMLDGATPVSYWGDFASGKENGSKIYLSDHAKGLNGQGTAWHTTTGSYPCRAICIDPHTPERVLYVSNNDKSVIREVKRVNGNLVDSTLKNASGNAVDFSTLIAADFSERIPGGATLAAGSFADITQLISDPNMEGLFYAIVGVHGVPNVWMTVDNGLTWTNAADNLPRSLWLGTVHPLTGDLLMDASLGRHILPPPAGYPNVTYKAALSNQLATFYEQTALPPPF